MMRTNPWMDVVRAAAALAAAMGIGRFAYTPILPLMTAHAGLTPQAAGQVATANFTRPDGVGIPLNLGVVATRHDGRWRIGFYQVSAVPD